MLAIGVIAMTSPGCVNDTGPSMCATTPSGLRGQSSLEGLPLRPGEACQLWLQTQGASALIVQAVHPRHLGLKSRVGWKKLAAGAAGSSIEIPVLRWGEAMARTPPPRYPELYEHTEEEGGQGMPSPVAEAREMQMK